MTDIEKAIEYLEEGVIESESHIEESFPALQKMLREQVGHFNSAIQALQEKAERDKGREYCNNGTAEGACDSDGMMRIDKGNEHCLPYIAVNNETYGTSDLFDINYCPMCGRKLTSAPTDER